MKDLLLRHWFLALLLGGVGLALFRPGWLRPGTERLEPRAFVAVALFLMAWGLESRSLFNSLLRPLPALWAVVISYGAVPALGWSLGWLLPDADLRIGLLIIASVPCTLASAVLWTRLAGGNEATALLVVLLTTATSWLATTAWLALGTGTEVAVDVPAMMQGLVLVLVLPVGLGQLSRIFGPMARAASRHKMLLGTISRLFILAIILKAAVGVSDRLAEKSASLAIGPLVATALLCLGIHLAALFGGLWSSRLLNCDRPNRIAVAFAGSQKTLPVALYLFDVYFVESHPLAVVPMVFYHVGQLVVDTLIAERLAKQPGLIPAHSATG
jgi:sodium/bile acid cotransporter 7